MGFPEPVARKLHKALGVEGEILVTWLEEERVERSMLRAEVTRLHADMAGMESRLGDRMAASEIRLGERIANVKFEPMISCHLPSVATHA